MPQVLFLTFFPDVASALGTVAESGGSWADDVADAIADAMDMSVADLWRESQGDEGVGRARAHRFANSGWGPDAVSPALD